MMAGVETNAGRRIAQIYRVADNTHRPSPADGGSRPDRPL